MKNYTDPKIEIINVGADAVLSSNTEYGTEIDNGTFWSKLS